MPRLFAYELPGGWRLFAGATDADNDYLSTRVALPNDWWFHTEDVPGSHVILRAKSEQEPESGILRQAAAIAAYHSKARAAKNARVYCTRARHVRKRRGSELGTVEVSSGKVIKVCPDNSFATRLPAAIDANGE